MKKILVTGGAGFIGSHLVKRLTDDGHEVIVIDNLMRGNKIERDVLQKIKLVKEDIRNREVVEKLSVGCNHIYHFAAILGVDVVADNPVETMEVEAEGMKNIAHAALENGVEKIIYASTSGVYGHSAIERSVTENIKLDPRTSYAIAKRFNEIYLAAMFEEKGLQSISLRFFNVYGCRQDNRMVIPRFFEQALKKRNITVYGTGKQTRDFTHVEDTVHASVQLAEKVKGCEIFNIANENEVTINQLAKEIVSLTGSSSDVVKLKSPAKRYDYEVERRFGNSEKMYKAIGYKPAMKLNIGLKKYYEYLKNEGLIKKNGDEGLN